MGMLIDGYEKLTKEELISLLNERDDTIKFLQEKDKAIERAEQKMPKRHKKYYSTR